MGWTIYPVHNMTPKEYWKNDYLPKIKNWWGENTGEVLAENSYGREFYAAVYNKRDNVVFPLVVLISKDRYGMAVKEMSGDEGPYYYHASDKVLDATTAENCMDWVKLCRKMKVKEKERKKLLASVVAGTTIKLDRPRIHNGIEWDTITMFNKKANLFEIKGLSGLFCIKWWKTADFTILEGVGA